MTQVGQLTDSFLEVLRDQVEQLDPRQRRAALTGVIRILAESASTGLRPGADSLDRATGNRAVVLCDWAADGGATEGEQLLSVDIRPGPTHILKTRRASGRQLITNGFLGADLIHVPAGEGFAPHTHPGDHLLFVVGGRGTITAAGEILETAPGQVYMVDGLQPHAVGAITDHVLLSVGAVHQRLDSPTRQELRPFEDLLSPDGEIVCRICDTTGRGREELQAKGCSHGPIVFDGVDA